MTVAPYIPADRAALACGAAIMVIDFVDGRMRWTVTPTGTLPRRPRVVTQAPTPSVAELLRAGRPITMAQAREAGVIR